MTTDETTAHAGRPVMDRDSALAELEAITARAAALRAFLAADDERCRRAAQSLTRGACSWCGAPNATRELDRWVPTGRYICGPQGAPLRCRFARMAGVSPEEYWAATVNSELKVGAGR